MATWSFNLSHHRATIKDSPRIVCRLYDWIVCRCLLCRITCVDKFVYLSQTKEICHLYLEAVALTALEWKEYMGKYR